MSKAGDKKGNGKIIVISAPSGGGKSTIINRIKSIFSNLFFSISATTRAPRGNEKNGVEYYFLTPDCFQKKITNNEFAEYKEVYGNFYGTLKSTVERNIAENKNTILDIDVQGALAIMEKYPQAITIFIKPPSFKILEQRLRSRSTDSEAAIRNRLEAAKEELGNQSYYKHIVINDNLDQAVNEIISILKNYQIT